MISDKVYKLLKKFKPHLEKIKEDKRKKVTATLILVLMIIAIGFYFCLFFTFKENGREYLEVSLALFLWPILFILAYLYKKPKLKNHE